MNDWLAIGEAVLPIFGLVALGAILKRLPLLDDKGWTAIDRIVYWVLFPALLFGAVSRAAFAGLALAPMAAGMVATVLLVTFIVFLIAKQRGTSRAERASLVMGSIRFNTFLGVAIAEQFLGETGLALTALCIAVMVPTVNVISIWTLQRGTPGGGMGRTLAALATNPLIIACVLGAGANLLQVEPEPVLMTAVSILGDGALPLGLLAIGAGLAFETLRRASGLLLVGVVLKIAVQPAIGFALLWAIGLRGPELTVAAMWLALPAAPSSYVMARTLGGDAPLMAALLTVQLVVSMASLPLLIGLMG